MTVVFDSIGGAVLLAVSLPEQSPFNFIMRGLG